MRSEGSRVEMSVYLVPAPVFDRPGRTRLVYTGYDGSERLQAELSREIDALLEE
jgi:hypothetical protein